MTLYDILMSDNVVKTINGNLDILLEYIPEIKNIMNFNQKHPYHIYDLWNHTLVALSFSKKDYEIRLSLLLHDIGKPFSYTEENGVRHYDGHNELSYKIAYCILSRLRVEESIRKNVLYLILNHDNPIRSNEIKKNYDLELKRFEVQRCDILAHSEECIEKRQEYLDKTIKKLIKYKK